MAIHNIYHTELQTINLKMTFKSVINITKTNQLICIVHASLRSSSDLRGSCRCNSVNRVSLFTAPLDVLLHLNFLIPTWSFLRNTTLQRLDAAIIIGSPEERNRKSLSAGDVDCTMDGGLEEIVCPAHQGIGNVDDKSSWNRSSLDPFVVSVQDLQSWNFILSENCEEFPVLHRLA